MLEKKSSESKARTAQRAALPRQPKPAPIGAGIQLNPWGDSILGGGAQIQKTHTKDKTDLLFFVTVHIVTDEDIQDYDTNYKMKPPLRGREDREALLQGLADGTVDAIATDHAPHPGSEKMQEFDLAPFGVIGFETALGLALDRLVHSGLVTLTRLVELLSVNPARIVGLDRGTLKVGVVADITVFDPERRWTYDVNQSYSRSRNTPFDGVSLRGGPVATIVAGKIVWQVGG